MSAPLAGKFQDHYKVLGIHPKSNVEAIQQAYGKLAQKYHPRNTQTGDQETFDAVNLAYEVLSDAGLRAEFDKLRSGGEQKAEFRFSGLDFFAALGHETALRAARCACFTTAAASIRSRRACRCAESRTCSKPCPRG